MTLTKDTIEQLKSTNLNQIYGYLGNGDNKAIQFVLDNLGFLPTEFDGTYLLPLLDHPNDSIRYGAVKNLSKIADFGFAERLFEIATHDTDSFVRREATSGIGRMRDERAIAYLLELLSDGDPKVVMQAIRGLLVFKRKPYVRDALKRLRDHKNETIRAVLDKEFSTNSDSAPPKLHSPNYIRNLAVLGDVREILQLVPTDSVHLTFTSPPYYNARDYSIYASYQEYLDFLTEVFAEVLRVTKEGRFFILNTSPVIVPRMSRAHSSRRYPIPFDIHPRLVEMGWEFIDDIIWVKPEPSVKNRNGGFMQHRKPLGYKPNAVTEYLMVYRKQTDKLLDWNMRQYDDETIEESLVLGDYETTNVWQIDPSFDRVHSAVFPYELCKRVVLYYSYIGDVVFDPFGGSGTLGRAALSLGRQFFITEMDENYFQRIRENLSSDLWWKCRFLTINELHDSLRNSHMRLTDIVIQNIITKLMHGEDYRTEVLALINARFLQYAIEFFGKVAQAKLRNEGIDGDWYKREFLLDPNLTKDEVVINSGLNTKTISNMYNSASKRVVLEVAPAYYDELYQAISNLAEQNGDIDITLTIKFRGVSVDLNISESLIVINTLAVKRAQLRGGAWSTAGKRVEKYLMLTLCRLYGVTEDYYELRGLTQQRREVDFYLISPNNAAGYFCEVKLMGKGNPESADAVIARDSAVFVADKLSDLNKTQLTQLGIHWVELRSQDGYKKFFAILNALGIPAEDFGGDIDEVLPRIFADLFPPDEIPTPDDTLDEEDFDTSAGDIE